jgi:hypothetical protein
VKRKRPKPVLCRVRMPGYPEATVTEPAVAAYIALLCESVTRLRAELDGKNPPKPLILVPGGLPN